MEEDEPTDINLNYVNHFKDHVACVSAHLNGADHGDALLRASYFPPSGFWTSADKDRFFHALAVHSRLRPDLIAAEIPGKTIVDVCVYLDLLAEASAEDAKKRNRSSFQPATEVSEKWVDYEEKQANAMAFMEPVWEAEHREDRREFVLRAERRAMRKHRGQRPRGIRDREDERRRNALLRESQARQADVWRKEDYMNDLDSAHLKIIDSILREAEGSFLPEGAPSVKFEDMTAGAQQKQSAVSTGITDSAIDPALSSAPGSSCIQSTASDQASRNADVTRVMFNEDGTGHGRDAKRPPVLTVHSNPVYDPATQSSTPEVNLHHSSDDYIVDPGNLSPNSRRRYQKRLYMRRKRAAQSGREVSTVAKRLKPGRKTNKKLPRDLVRDKTREDDGGENMDVAEVNLGDAQFSLPIQKDDEKEEHIDIYGGREEVDISLGEHDDDPSKGLAEFHSHIGGITPPYKIKKELLDFEYDASALQSNGLGLFHLSGFSNLMSLHASLQESEPGIASHISAPLIRLLHAEAVTFVTDLMYRVTVLHEQDRLSKEHTRVWRLGNEQIKAQTIHSALEAMGAVKDKKEHFVSLVSQLTSLRELTIPAEGTRDKEGAGEITFDGGSDSDEEGRSGVEERSENSDHGDSSIDEDNDSDRDVPEDAHETKIMAVALHREIHAPFVWDASLDHFVPDPYRSSGPLCDTDQSVTDVVGDMDDNELSDELVEEDELDAADLAAAKEAEAELWVKFGPRERIEVATGESSPERLVVDPVETIDVARGLSTQYTTARRRIRSNEFIGDSD